MVKYLISSAFLIPLVLNSSSAFSYIKLSHGLSRHFAPSTKDFIGNLEETMLQQSTSLEHEEKSTHLDGLSILTLQIRNLMDSGNLPQAIELLKESTKTDHDILMKEGSYQIAFHKLATGPVISHLGMVEDLFQALLDEGYQPNAEICNSIIAAWSKSSKPDSSSKCIDLIKKLWDEYAKTGDDSFVPMRSSYISTIVTLSRSRRQPGGENAEMAEALLEEMEEKRLEHPRLSPNTIAVNAVLNAWSKSRSWYGAARRSEQIVERMINLSRDRPELKPDTTSFNTVINTLAKSKESDRERRAEILLERMEDLSTEDPSMKCRPNEISFNSVINCWAKSRQKGSARRATAILRHMTKRYEIGASKISPDAASYTTTINAWARSWDHDAVQHAEEILALCEQSFANGNKYSKPNALTYNSMINCYSKSKDPNASEKALAMLDLMKQKSMVEEDRDCEPDVVTYTTVIDALAKKKTGDAAAKAVELLEELEDADKHCQDGEKLRPNIRTYTSTINAIGRSGKNPERAEAILERIEMLASEGNKAVIPDTVCYNAVINAYGWSNTQGKAQKCFSILKRMIDLSESRENTLAKPDIITCNSVMNACAFETTGSQIEREKIIQISVETLEIFQNNVPIYGYPDHSTYAQVLFTIAKQMPFDEKRFQLAEATFWQCCQAGHVNSRVISALEKSLPWDRFSTLMGSALKSKEGARAIYDLETFPKTWTRHAAKQIGGGQSRASRKRDRGYKVTNQSLTRAKKISAKENDGQP